MCMAPTFSIDDENDPVVGLVKSYGWREETLSSFWRSSSRRCASSLRATSRSIRSPRFSISRRNFFICFFLFFSGVSRFEGGVLSDWACDRPAFGVISEFNGEISGLLESASLKEMADTGPLWQCSRRTMIEHLQRRLNPAPRYPPFLLAKQILAGRRSRR